MFEEFGRLWMSTRLPALKSGNLCCNTGTSMITRKGMTHSLSGGLNILFAGELAIVPRYVGNGSLKPLCGSPGHLPALRKPNNNKVS